MTGEGRTIHPYDLLASPKRRKIIKVLENGPLAYSEVMERTGIDDSGKLGYHLGVLSHYIDHKDNLYSLSFEGRLLSRAASEFEQKTYGVSAQALFSGEVDTKGYMKVNSTLSISIITPTGEVREWDLSNIDREKMDAAIASRMMGQNQQANLANISIDVEENRMMASFEVGRQTYQEKDGWLVGRSGAVPLEAGQDRAFPFPGLHFRAAGTVLFPQGAEIRRNFPEEKALEDAGLEIYEFTPEGLNLRWRVRKDDMLYLGETRTEGLDGPREVFESEFHVSGREPMEQWGETRKRIVDLPRLVTGETRFRVKPK
jgi:hypothetical protein